MKLEELANRIAEYVSLRIAPSMTDCKTIFVCSAAGSAIGRKVIADKLRPLFCMVADENGDVDPNALREFMLAGMERAHKLPVLMGLVTISKSDVEEFFSTV